MIIFYKILWKFTAIFVHAPIKKKFVGFFAFWCILKYLLRMIKN